MTLLDLVRDPEFDPTYQAPRVDGKGHGSRVDVKPWSRTRESRNHRPKLRLITCCQVCGGAPYTPEDEQGRRVCGYCRGMVRLLRDVAQSAEGGAA